MNKYRFKFSTGPYGQTIEVIGVSYEHALSVAREQTGLNSLIPIGDGIRIYEDAS